MIARLPPLAKGADDEKGFALREGSKPPPRAGKTVTTPFPPPASPPPAEVADSGPLRVLRASPTGEVGIAPSFSITFSQPMVAVTGVGDLASQAVPVKLSPEPPGKWRWLGTKTLVFEPSPRFPMATEYTVEVPAGTPSATGGKLGKAEAVRFGTPAPVVQVALPEKGPTRRDPVIFVGFDQKVDPTAVLRTTKVVAGVAAVEMRIATAEEIAADPGLEGPLSGRNAATWMALRPKAPLPLDTSVTVTVGPGTPSAEGPRTTTKARSWSFRTYAANKITGHECGWGPECRPFMPFRIELANPIDAKRFDPGMVRADPPIPGMKVEVWGSALSISGRTKGDTTYSIALAPTLPDTFGQPLGKSDAVRFEVGSASPALTAEGGDMVVLDPAGGARFSVYSVNHDALDVRAYAVGPEHWNDFVRWRQSGERRGEPPGRKVIDTTVGVKGDDDELVETRLDLAPALKGGLGHAVLIVSPEGLKPKDRDYEVVEKWVQSTRIGLDAFVDASELVGWATSLADGKPLEGVELSLQPGGAKATTVATGIGTLALGAAPGALLVARRGGDTALLPENTWGGGGSWQLERRGPALRWFVFDDRGMYRPGEEVKIKGWIRRVGTGEGGDVMALDVAAESVAYKLLDGRGNEIAKGTAPLGGLGGFDATLKLPPTTNLGYCQLLLQATGGPPIEGMEHQHAIQVQEFRRPEYEVSTRASEGPLFVGGHADVAVRASYYAGGGLPGADVAWNVTAEPGHFTPPNRSDYTFGTWEPWWPMMHGIHGGGGGKSKSMPAQTDAAGTHHLRIDFDAVQPPRATSVTASASVTDVNRQAWSASSTLLVHPAAHYVGLKAPRMFVQEGEALPVDAIVTDLDGKAMTGRPIAMRAVRIDWRQVAGEEVEEELDPEECKVSSGAEAVRCTFHPKAGGQHRITATITDAQGRPNETEITLWVAGGKSPPSREVQQEQVSLVPDKKEYRRGDVAEILVLPPFSPAEALVTLRRSGIVRTERVTIAGSSTTLRVPIEDRYVPNVEIQIDLVGAAPRVNDRGEPEPSLPKRPAFASGSLSLAVPPLERTLSVRATPRERGVEPGGRTVVDVDVRDAGGKPVRDAEVAVIVVDEAILALSGYATPDPIAAFYTARSADARDYHLRGNIVLGRPGDLAAANGAPGGGGDKRAMEGSIGQFAPAPPPAPPGQAPAPMASAAPESPAAQKVPAASTPIKVRTDFNALAVFAPRERTDAAGRVEVPVKLPDSLTRYRVMAVAVAADRFFGSGEGAITARLPIMARPSPPRFLSFGDRFELPVVVQNQTDKALEVDVAVRAGNASLTAGAGRRVTVPARDRVEVRFPAAAARAGTARFQIGVASGPWADAAEVALPVWSPATTEAFATYGELDAAGAIAQPVSAPSGAVAEYGGLEVTTSSTALQALTDAVLYLVSYPFECSEQISSRVMAIASLKDVLGAFQADGLPDAPALVASVKRDVERLALLQNDDGGFAFWRRGTESWPFLSVHVAHALQRAKDKGFAVPAPVLERSKGYLRGIEARIPRWYGVEERRAILAYALYTRARMGDRDVGRARRLVAEVGGADKLPLEGAGFLLSVLSGAPDAGAEVAGIRTMLGNRVTETAGAAHFASSYSDEGGYVLLPSERRADGIVLEALIGDQPKSDLIPKLVAGLMAHRKAGRWGSTQENAFVLLALDRYFSTYEKVTPDFVARTWLGNAFAGEHAFKGRTTERHHVDVPMKDVIAAGGKDLVLSKEGAGRLYYRIGMRYAPKDLRLPPSSNGFTVERVYEPVDAAGDVRRDPDGTWRIKAGAKVRVRLSMLAPSRRYHVALVDPLPAGLEPMNPALAVTGEVPRDPKAPNTGWWWSGTWYEHQNLRDERVEAFTTLLWEGLHGYSYVARATTPGGVRGASAQGRGDVPPRDVRARGERSGDRRVTLPRGTASRSLLPAAHGEPAAVRPKPRRVSAPHPRADNLGTLARARRRRRSRGGPCTTTRRHRAPSSGSTPSPPR